MDVSTHEVDLSEGSLLIALEQLAAKIPGARLTVEDEEVDAALADWGVERLGHLYWIAKEATTNAQKHADADTIRIRLTRAKDAIVLSVEDDERGFVPEDQSEERWGLRTMGDRADLLGGGTS